MFTTLVKIWKSGSNKGQVGGEEDEKTFGKFVRKPRARTGQI